MADTTGIKEGFKLRVIVIGGGGLSCFRAGPFGPMQ